MASFTWMVNLASDGVALLGESSLRAAVLMGAAWAACWLLRRRSAALRHLIWALSLAALVAAPATLDLAPRLRIPSWGQAAVRPAGASADHRSARPSEQPGAPGRGSDTTAVALDLGAEALEFAAAPRTPAVPNPAQQNRNLLPALLMAIWGLGFLILFARIVIGHVRVRSMARGAAVLDAGAGFADCLMTGRPVRFLRSTGETMPMTWGWRNPCVLLPASFEQWDHERRTMTIRHELAHIQRADWLTQTLAQFVRAVYWFHPLVWRALGRIRIEADRACDDIVLRAGVKPSGYAGHLVQSAREFRTAGLRPWVAIAMAHPSSLNHRVRYVLDETVERAALGRRRALAWALGVTLIVVAVPSIEAEGQHELPAAGLQVELELAVPQTHDAVPDPVSVPIEQELEAVAQELTLLAQAQESAPRNPSPEVAGSEPQSEAERNLRAFRSHTAELEARLHELGQQGRMHGPKYPPLSPQALQTAGAALRKALGSADANVRAEAAEALGQLGSPEQANLEALAKALADEEPRVRNNAAESLGHLVQAGDGMPADDAVRWLTPALDSTDAAVRRQAAEALGRLRGAEAISLATRLAGDADPQVQREAVESLGRLLRGSDAQAARAALPVLREALRHDDPSVRRQLVETLGSLRSIADEVVPLLAQAVEDPDPAVQREAVEALGKISSPGSGHWLEGAVEKNFEYLNQSMEKLRRSYGSYGEI